jgi:Sulfotransferase family
VKGEAQRYFFIHVQKAAGTSLVFRLRGHFGRAAIYPPESDRGNTIMVDDLVKRWRTHGHETRVVTGHFPLCVVGMLSGRFTTLTVLREPVERTLSYLRHHRQLTPEDSGKSLEEIYDDPFRFQGFVHNHMVKMFSLTADEMTAGMLTPVEFTRDHLERAKTNLATVDVIGLQECFGEFCDELTRRFGWDLGDDARLNRTQRFDVSERFRARIAEDNAFDLELYEFAQELVELRRRRAPAPSVG